MIWLEAAWRHRLACAGEAACSPAVECYRRRQTATDARKQNNTGPRILCVGGPVVISLPCKPFFVGILLEIHFTCWLLACLLDWLLECSPCSSLKVRQRVHTISSPVETVAALTTDSDVTEGLIVQTALTNLSVVCFKHICRLPVFNNFLRRIWFSFSALTLLVGRHEGHLVSNKTVYNTIQYGRLTRAQKLI